MTKEEILEIKQDTIEDFCIFLRNFPTSKAVSTSLGLNAYIEVKDLIQRVKDGVER